MRRGLLEGGAYKWWAFGSIALGTFFSALDHGSVNIALPRIETHFQTDLPTVQWVVVGYALAISVFLMPMGRWGDMWDRKKVYLFGMVLYILGAGIAGAAVNIQMLIGLKVVQGVGSAMLQGNAMAGILSIFPGSERGKALGMHLSVVGAGIIAGPALGGFLVNELGWRWVFYINVPAGVLAFIAPALILDRARLGEGSSAVAGGRRFDFAGAALSAGALLLFLMVMTNGHRAGWTSPMVTVGGAAAVLLVALFVFWELRSPAPMLDVRLLLRKRIGLGVSASFISFLGSSSVVFLMPFYLQKVQDFSPREAGLVMIPGAAALTVSGPIAGRLSDRFGWRNLCMAGLACSSSALLILSSKLDLDSPLTLILPSLVLSSTGMGLFNSPNNNAILSGVERSRYGVISALTQMVRNSGNVTSIALSTAIVVATMSSRGFEPSLDAVTPEGGGEVAAAFVEGMHRAFVALGVILAVAIILPLLRGDRTAREQEAASQAGAQTG